MLRIFRVRGHSMQPTLNEGDYVVALGRLSSRIFKPKIGKLLVVDHAKHGVMIKRVCAVNDDCFELIGDGTDTLSTAEMGEFNTSHLLGKVLWCVKQDQSLWHRLYRMIYK